MSRADLSSLPAQVLRLLSAHRPWIPVALAYLAAWWLPVSWIWSLAHPGVARPEGIDGPISWLWWDQWGRTDSPNSFQFFLPLGVALLTWDRRLELIDAWERVLRHEREGRKRSNKRTPLVVVLGCCLLAVSHLTHLPSLAIASLIAIAAGVVVHIYGTAMLQPLRLPLTYWLLMVPLPASLSSKFATVVSNGTIRAAVATLHAFGKPAKAFPLQIQLGGTSIDVGSPMTLGAGGAAIFALASAIVLTHGLKQRRPWGKIFLRIGISAIFGLCLNVARVDLALLLRAGGSLSLADRLLALNVWFLALPAALLTIYGEAILRRVQTLVKKKPVE